MSKFFIAFLAFLLSVPAVAEDQALARLFAQQGIVGTIVISSLHNGKTFIHNDPRAKQRFSTASTFKILNTLISLEENAISGKDDVLTWDGHIYDFPDWNRDQTLESAFKVSCVWCFQELARRVGAEKYRNYLRKSDYGELREPFEETTFWLDGSLQISAIEQVNFLKKSSSAHSPIQCIVLRNATTNHACRANAGFYAVGQDRLGNKSKAASWLVCGPC